MAFLTLFLKILGLQGKVPNASAGSWFQFLWSYLQSNTSRYLFFPSCPQFSENDQPYLHSKALATCRV